MTETAANLTSDEIIEQCSGCLLDRKAEDIVALDLRHIADFTDFFVVCTGSTDVHVRAIADAVIEGMKHQGQHPLHVEGYNTRRWVLIDFVDVIIHVLQPEERSFYGLERLWGDAPVREISDEQPASAGELCP